MRLSRGVRGAGAAGLVVGAVLWLVTAAGATPPDLTDDFDGGSDGWSLYEGGSIGPADWFAAGGNPGGFLSHTDAGGGSHAAFGDAGYVAHLSRYYERARIVADLRSTAVGAPSPTVRLVDPDYATFGSISSSSGPPLGADWHHYSFPLRAASGWYDDDGDRLDSGELRRFLALDPVILVDAGYGAGARTDLDNVGLIQEWPRSVSIRAKAGHKGFKGVIKVLGGFDEPQCLDSEKVRILRVRKGRTRVFGSATTDSVGKYSLSRTTKPGRYFAKAPLAPQEMGPPCGAAKSKTIRVKR
jgi:hypothetical protein